MPANFAQFAQLSSALGKAEAQVLIDYIDSQVRPTQQAVSVLQDVTPPVVLGRAIVGVARALDADFIIDALRDAIATYVVELTAPVSLLIGTSSASVLPLLDRVAVSNALKSVSATLSLGLSITPTERHVTSLYVPAGTTVHLASSVTGSGVVTLISGQEVLL